MGKTRGEPENLTLDDFHFTKKTDKASPKLMEAAAKGKPFPKVTLEVVTLGSAPGAFLPGMPGWLQLKVLTYVFEDVYITSYSTGLGPGGDPSPIEVFMLNFQEDDL